MKRIFTFMKLDALLSVKDSITLYSLLSPLALAFVITLVLPGVQEQTIRFAAEASLPQELISSLEEYGPVELLDDADAVRLRVGEFDDAAGILSSSEGIRVVLEGNERGFDELLIKSLVTSARGTPEGFIKSTRSLGGDGAPIAGYAAVLMVMLGLLIGGLLIGFSIVEEKESGVIRALAISPIKIREYLIARATFALIIGAVSGSLSLVIITGFSVSFASFAPALMISLLAALPFGFIIGSFADNQMTAFALVKLLMGVFMSLPLVSIFVPASLQWIFYPLPNYWMFVLLSNAVIGEAWTHTGYLVSAIATALSGVLFTLLLLPAMRRRLKIR